MTRSETMTPAQVGEWYKGAAERWPAVFQPHDLGLLWKRAWARHKEAGDAFVPLLRAALLKRARAAAGRCQDCSLSQNRLASRPVFDDGDVANDWIGAGGTEPLTPISTTTAQIMIVGEGAGVFEQRTGVPFISYQSLAGASLCARECRNYEDCYNDKSKFPQRPCQPEPLRQTLDEAGILTLRTQRADTPLFPIQTVGTDLDLWLLKAGLWREAWNPRNRLRVEGKPPQPGTVYLCNATKCRACDSEGKDRRPTPEEIAACAPWLAMQIYIIQPRVVVALGNTALAALTEIKEPKALSLRGRVLPCVYGDIPVLAEVHPSYIVRLEDKVRRGKLQQEFIQSLLRAKEMAANGFQMEPPAIGVVPGIRQAVLDLDIHPSAAAYIPTLPNGEDFPIAAKEAAPA